MANYYLDFVGLNTFIYEPVGYEFCRLDNGTGVLVEKHSEAGTGYPLEPGINNIG